MKGRDYTEVPIISRETVFTRLAMQICLFDQNRNKLVVFGTN